MAMHSIPESLSWANPIVQEWFVRKFGTPTEPQEQGWPHILAGRTTLISAPTGSGKTLAAFLICIDTLVRKALTGQLSDRTEILYVSPLKALGNDIQKNLEGPLAEITALAGEKGLLMPQIRTAVRTGDTLMYERQKMLKRPPHILVTTPESLYILLTAQRSRGILADVKTVIVDEIHAVADDKRGAHLALSLERLDILVTQAQPRAAVPHDPLLSQTQARAPVVHDSLVGNAQPPVRIGLSATQKPIKTVAHFLTRTGRPDPLIGNMGWPRSIAVGLQRVGRAGHWRGAITKGRFFPTTRDELMECAALVRAIHQGDLDRLIVPEAPLDILAQQMVAMCSAEDWHEDELFAAVTRGFPKPTLPLKNYTALRAMLSKGIA